MMRTNHLVLHRKSCASIAGGNIKMHKQEVLVAAYERRKGPFGGGMTHSINQENLPAKNGDTSPGRPECHLLGDGYTSFSAPF
jgi:hypothetical protein